MGGFLDHSTNNIIVDAVLTDTGRRFLARNDGSFSIVKFALADDEVDYTIIKKYGRIIGKEKIEKNTPVQEALTTSAHAQKYKMLSLSNSQLLSFPTLSLTIPDTTNDILSLYVRRTPRFGSVILEQTISGDNVIEADLREEIFEVTVNNQLLTVRNASPDTIDRDNRAIYRLTRDPSFTDQGGAKITIPIETKTVTDTQFTVLGTTGNKNLIRTFVKVTGINSGQVKEFEVDISKT